MKGKKGRKIFGLFGSNWGHILVTPASHELLLLQTLKKHNIPRLAFSCIFHCWASDKKFRRRASSMKSGSSTALPVIVKKSFESCGSNCFSSTPLPTSPLSHYFATFLLSALVLGFQNFSVPCALQCKNKVISVHIECLLKRVHDVGKYLSRLYN